MKISHRLATTFKISALVACSITTAPAFPFTASPLPIQASASIASPRAFETPHQLIIAGSASPTLRTPAVHVDVQLLGPAGRIVAEKSDRLTWAHPRTAAGRHGRATFTGSFPLDAARQAQRIVITYKSGPHANCVAAKS